jgi:HAD superfamily hydrolase (TIGR01549 family)
MIQAIIFDLDGTLVNMPIDYKKLYAKIEEQTNVKIRGLAKTLQTVSKEKHDKAFEIWTSEEIEALSKMTVIENGLELYKNYSNKLRALVTMQGRETVNVILRKLGLKFQFIITREDSLDRIEQIKIAVEKLNVQVGKVLIIGDRESDSKAAQKVGCQFQRI